MPLPLPLHLSAITFAYFHIIQRESTWVSIGASGADCICRSNAIKYAYICLVLTRIADVVLIVVTLSLGRLAVCCLHSAVASFGRVLKPPGASLPVRGD